MDVLQNVGFDAVCVLLTIYFQFYFNPNLDWKVGAMPLKSLTLKIITKSQLLLFSPD